MAIQDDLLEQAGHLARREPRRPKQASLRRAVSAAYYALFHLLIDETTRNWKHVAQRSELGRSIDHGRLKKACEKRRALLNDRLKGNPPPCRDLDIVRHLHAVTDTVIKLQQDRHTADYDNSARWSRTGVQAKIDSAAAAFASWKDIRHERTAQEFLVTLLLKDR
jgi:hypothetical protein